MPSDNLKEKKKETTSEQTRNKTKIHSVKKGTVKTLLITSFQYLAGN